jgi:dihydrofolate synthase/folylpolyglutamate synthase
MVDRPQRVASAPASAAAPARADLALSLEALFRRTTHGIRPGLDVIRALLDRLGRPERAWPAIHVAGTNGKGSVCAMIESVFRAAGVRTGLYTSPHLVRFNERLRVGGRPASDAAVAALLADAEREASALEREGGLRPATFFELTTAMAFEHFRREGVALGVIETGMGGRWDATNVVVPLVAAVCDVDLDHADYLGDSIEKIAAEKCGILQRGRPAVCGIENPAARAVFRETAAALGAPAAYADEEVSVRRTRQDWDGQRLSIETPVRRLPPLTLPLLGDHQLRNVAVAVAAVEAAASAADIAMPDAAMVQGLERVRWPARMQVLARDPVVLLDGAHNPHAARALARSVRALSGRQPVAWIVGMLADKDAALAWARAEGGIVCVAGSLFLAGEVLGRKNEGIRLFENGRPAA